MMQSATREQWITYAAAVAKDQATQLRLEPCAHVEHLECAIEVAALEYDLAQ